MEVHAEVKGLDVSYTAEGCVQTEKKQLPHSFQWEHCIGTLRIRRPLENNTGLSGKDLKLVQFSFQVSGVVKPCHIEQLQPCAECRASFGLNTH